MTGQTRRHRLTGILGLCGPLAAAMFVFADLAGISMTPGYSPITQAISELMERDAPAKLIVDPLLVAYHGLVIPFAAGLHRGLPRGVPELAGPLLIGLAGVAGVILTLFFPCDPGCTPFTSLRGTLHIFIAIPMGFAILIGIRLQGDGSADIPRSHAMLMSRRGSASLSQVSRSDWPRPMSLASSNAR